jgi:hypothetical protein
MHHVMEMNEGETPRLLNLGARHRLLYRTRGHNFFGTIFDLEGYPSAVLEYSVYSLYCLSYPCRGQTSRRYRELRISSVCLQLLVPQKSVSKSDLQA